MRDQLLRFMRDYPEAKEQSFANNLFGIFVRTEIPEAIYETDLVNRQKYLITASVGAGNWAMIPWICVFDKSITTSATKGIYIVYLLSKDSKRLYLTFNQGCTDIRSQHTKKETIQIMHQKAKEIRSFISDHGFISDCNIDLGDHLTDLGEMYREGIIFYKQYNINSLPEEDVLRDNLSRMIDIYQNYVQSEKQKGQTGIHTITGDETEMKTAEKLNVIKAYISGKGFSYDGQLIENFYLSLKSKPFVILAGTSGTGKTRLVRLFAEAIGAQYHQVAVRPDWSDSTDLFGHTDLNGTFVPGCVLEFLVEAQRNPDHPYILCLDEMNLARVEYYLSDFLSVIETREFQGEKIKTDPLVPATIYGKDTAAQKKYGEVFFPENLYVVGTVNMDETTFPFSRKVLDRANTIEFNYVSLVPDFSGTVTGTPLLERNAFLKTEYLMLAQCPEDAQEDARGYCLTLEKINRILQTANAHVGYRVRDEICFYLLNNRNAHLMSDDAAMDHEIMQKILPRIQGSGASIKDMLCRLFREILAGDYDRQAGDAAGMEKRIKENGSVRYPKSAEKVMFMVRRFEEDGFTSYWL